MVTRSGINQCAAVGDVSRVGTAPQSPSGPDLYRSRVDGRVATVTIVAREGEPTAGIVS